MHIRTYYLSTDDAALRTRVAVGELSGLREGNLIPAALLKYMESPNTHRRENAVGIFPSVADLPGAVRIGTESQRNSQLVESFDYGQ
jgi:hypothetical protein